MRGRPRASLKRAVVAESTACRERAVGRESTVCCERAADTESTEHTERAEEAESTEYDEQKQRTPIMDDLTPDDTFQALWAQISTISSAVPLKKWNKDHGLAARTMLSDQQARFLVDGYYTMQENRKRTTNQSHALAEAGEPATCLDWLKDQDEKLERWIAGALGYYVSTNKMGPWLEATHGIGRRPLGLRGHPQGAYRWPYLAVLRHCRFWPETMGEGPKAALERCWQSSVLQDRRQLNEAKQQPGVLLRPHLPRP